MDVSWLVFSAETRSAAGGAERNMVAQKGIDRKVGRYLAKNDTCSVRRCSVQVTALHRQYRDLCFSLASSFQPSFHPLDQGRLHRHASEATAGY